MVPVASYTYSIQSGTGIVTFTDTSTGSPDSWRWDFGDGNIAVLQNPIHTFGQSGTYPVELAVSNNDGTDTHTILITITINPVIVSTLKIIDYINYKLPPSFISSLASTEVSDLILKWQNYVGPLLTPPVPPASIANESAYVPLARTLLGELVALDILLAKATNIMGGFGSAADKQANLKKLETGPAQAEWYNSETFWANATKPGGLIDLTKSTICAIAGNLNIFLPWCGPRPRVRVQIKKGGVTVCNINPSIDQLRQFLLLTSNYPNTNQ